MSDQVGASILQTVRRKSTAAAFRAEIFVRTMLVGSVSFSVFVTLAIVILLVRETVAFFQFEEVSLGDFLFGLKWSPMMGSQKHFGIWPLVSGTFVVSVVAMVIAIPLGLVTAIYLSEYASPKVRAILKPALEILAGIPTVVYGLFALTFITPILRSMHEGFNPQNLMAAGIAVGILCLPTVSSLCEDALRAVPRSLREAAYGLGGTKFDVSVRVVLPAALSGIISAFLLAIARAVGETMIVALAAGNVARLTVDPRNSAYTMTGYITQMAKGDVSNFGIEYSSMFAVGAALFAITLLLTFIGQLIRKYFRESYE